MTVSELIQLLKDQPQDAIVFDALTGIEIESHMVTMEDSLTVLIGETK